MQLFGQGKPPLGVIFDSDMGNTIDDAVALALLYGFDTKNESRVVCLSVSRTNLDAAAFTDSVARFYAGLTYGRFVAFARGLPVGMSEEGYLPRDTPWIRSTLARKDNDGAPLFRHTIEGVNDTAEVAALIRNALTSQYDQNCVVVLSGPASNLVRTMALPGVTDLIVSKSRMLVFNGGDFTGGGPEAAVAANVEAARKLFAEWPGPVVAVGREIGEAVPYPAASIEHDFAWAPHHPVVDAYRAVETSPRDAPSGALAACLYAVRPQEGYFRLSEPGVIRVTENGLTQFTPAANGRHKYLVFDPAQKERIAKAYTEIASAKPVLRQPRFRTQMQDKDEKPDPKKSEAPKPQDAKTPEP